MSESLFQMKEAQAHYNRSNSRIIKYSIEVFHKGLNEHKVITAPDFEILKNKVLLQSLKWDEKWELLSTKKAKQLSKEESIEDARNKTEEAQNLADELENILNRTLQVNDAINWDSLKNNNHFIEKLPNEPIKNKLVEYPSPPQKDALRFTPTFTFWEKLFQSKKEKKIEEYEIKYKEAVIAWENERKNVKNTNDYIEKKYEEDILNYKNLIAEWENRKHKFLEEQEKYNEGIDKIRDSYLSKNPTSIIEYCEMVLNNSHYPDFISKNFEIEYNEENEILIVEYELPNYDNFPKLKEVKYISSKNEIKETFYSESEVSKKYEDTIYKITLRTIHELFEADSANALQAISFNGWTNSINKATGNEENNCIVSIQVSKNEFQQIDLSKVDPKSCFKNLKGVSASKLSTLTPIKPIIMIDKSDRRFVEGYNVASELDSATNLAAMDWEDFEHLIRELFEKEFKSNGGEVKVTQASRDGGVDAIAFDPDPIRGGKIVIQAKRYTNTVSVSAVRDLYGTVMNEGATKGILVSTADYGADAYEFAKGKPLTLLNGSNLLHLLEKHGHHAKIDLREAKKILIEKEKHN